MAIKRSFGFLGGPVRAVRRLGFVLAFVASAAATADDGIVVRGPPDPAALGGLVADLVGWIGDHTHYDVTRSLNDPPSVYLCDKGTTIRYEDREITIATEGLLRAIYDAKNRRIHLVRPWSSANISDRSSLLHELIHDVQYLSRDWACKENPEWEAYKLQDAWLAEHGVPSDFNWTHIFLLSSCLRDTHL